MLYSPLDLKLFVQKDVDGYKCQATGERCIPALRPDDSITNKGQIRLIHNLKTLRMEYRMLVAVQTVLAFVLWCIAAFTVYHTVTSLLLFGGKWWSYILPAFTCCLALLFTPQVIDPVVRDARGMYVHLRTGRSNLNGGCHIL